MARLFVEPARLREEIVVATGEDHRYLTRVLRLSIGDSVVLFDGVDEEADATILRIGPRALEMRVTVRRAAAAPSGPQITLIQSLTKAAKFDWIVQKATELGVSRIIPTISMRAIPRVDAMSTLGRRARWQKIAREAARQSGRIDVPEVEPVTAFHTAIAAAPKDGLSLILWEGARQQGLRGALPIPAPNRITVAVGPEGGFSAAEIDDAKAQNFIPVGLGARILRTETAPIALLAIVGFAVGDLG